MSPLRRPILCLAAVAAAITTGAQPVAPASANPSPAADATNAADLAVAAKPVARPPVAQSPVDFFRKLLALSPQDRDKLLASRPDMARARVLAKVREYAAMSPDERELRLRATELRWYLLPLMRAPKADRKAQLARIPPAMRELVESRLTQWDILPPPLQEEFLSHDTARYFAQAPGSATNTAQALQQERIARQVNRFFELTSAEKEQLLGKLPDSERTQMEQTLKTFEQLPLAQRNLCVRNYARFAGMSEAERAEFLKNAESWSKMSSDERQTWRDLVANVPSWPPLPPVPPMPPPMPPPPATGPQPAQPGVAVTN